MDTRGRKHVVGVSRPHQWRSIIGQVLVLIAIDVDPVDVILEVQELLRFGIAKLRQQNRFTRFVPVESVDHDLEPGVGAVSKLDELVRLASAPRFRIDHGRGLGAVHGSRGVSGRESLVHVGHASFDSSKRQLIEPRTPQRVGVRRVRQSVVVVVRVQGVTDAVRIVVAPLPPIEGKRIDGVVHAVPVGVTIGEVPNSVTIGIEPVSRLQREGVDHIRRPVVVVVRIDGVVDAVSVSVAGSTRPLRNRNRRQPLPDDRPGSRPAAAVAARLLQIRPRVEVQKLGVVLLHVHGIRVQKVVRRGFHEHPEPLTDMGRADWGPLIGRRPRIGAAWWNIVRLSPEATAPGVEATPVDRGVPFEKAGEKTRSLRAAHEDDPVMIDGKLRVEPALQQFVDETRIRLGPPHSRPGAVHVVAEKIRRGSSSA